jgi:hypothetical protein
LRLRPHFGQFAGSFIGFMPMAFSSSRNLHRTGSSSDLSILLARSNVGESQSLTGGVMVAKSDEERTVHARIEYVYDKEIHVSSVRSPADGLFVDVREFIPSKDFYGRGLTLPIGMLHDLLEGIESVWHEHGAGEGETEPPSRRRKGK